MLITIIKIYAIIAGLIAGRQLILMSEENWKEGLGKIERVVFILTTVIMILLWPIYLGAWIAGKFNNRGD